MISGQRINTSKSFFTVDRKTPNLRIQCIQQVTGFHLKFLPITYLGAPLFKGNKKGVLFDGIVQKIKSRITSWEKALLSHGGRLQLIKSVLSAMPLYLIQVLKPPKFVIERIERLFNKFFWGSFGEQKKIHWTSWDSACFPTEEGGLGVRRIDDMSEAFQYKAWWRFRNQSSLWAQFTLDKYCKGSHPLIAPLPHFASPNWKRLWRLRKEADRHCFWSLGEGKISFWFDNWVGEKPLGEQVSEHPWSFASVSFFWTDNKWDYLKLSQALPLNLVQQISNIPFDPTCADSIYWKLSTNGTFSTKSIWGQIRQTKSSQHLLREIWCPYIPPTMSVFLWRLINNNIPVDTRL
ncbi:UNVERIFIED_CONTAM: hypothetical protein Sradi_4886400 [Sesamum radiatum]|uniref:Reverse transcriptase zinc-binding domain-containing protein n=1 Tax=Sesamum radiatum TaxID=300843 RepID=A0AAW2MBW5_SESRA